MKYRFIYASIVLSVGLVLSCSSNSSTTTKAQSNQPDNTTVAKTDLPRKVEVETEMLAGRRLHDGALELQHIGDIKSVPALLVVLKENPPSKTGTMVCTAAHALQALRGITKANPGFRYEDWVAWWDEYRKQNPDVAQN